MPEGKDHSEVSLKISLISKYTSTLVIKQSNFSINKIVDTKVEVAIYHDFKMAEVIRFNGKKQFWVRNRYPNKNMLHKDEKYQWNKFLSEWLEFSKKEGLADILLKIN